MLQTTAVIKKETDQLSYPTLIVLFLMVLVVFFSFFYFSDQSIRLDESQSIWQTSHSPVRIIEIIAQDVHVPLYHLVLHFWEFFFGTNIVVVRLLSLLFFLISIPLFYNLAKLSLSKQARLFAVFLFALSPFMNWYGNEARMYSLFVFLTILNQYFFMRIYKDVDEANPLVWTGYFISFFLGIFTHYFFLFYIVVQAVFYLSYRNIFPKHSFFKFASICLVGGLLLSPWVWYVRKLGIAGRVGPLLFSPSSISVFNTFSQFLFGFQNDHINSTLLSLWPIAVLLVFLALRQNKKVPLDSIYYFLSFVLPIMLVFLISVFIRPIYLTRYLVFTLPSFYLFLSWVISNYSPKISHFLKAFLVFSMLFTLIIEAGSATTTVKENYREAVEFLNQNVSSQDLVIVSAPFTLYPVGYYYNASAPLRTLPIWDRYESGLIPAFSKQELQNDVSKLKSGYKTVWVLLSYDQGYESDINLYFETHFQRVLHRNFSQGLNLYAYKLRYDDEYLKYTENHPSE